MLQNYQPSKLEQLSAALNRLSCTFVFDEKTNITCFFIVFREARRLREVIEDVLLVILTLYGVVVGTLTLVLALGFSIDYIGQFQTLYLIGICIPFNVVTCLARQTDNTIMKLHVASPKYVKVLTSTVIMIKGAFVAGVLATVFLTGIHLLQMQLIAIYSETATGQSISAL